MVTFKKFLVEKIVGNTGWVYHRAKKNPEDSEILTHGIKPSTNESAMYGKGLYCCYDLNEQLKPNMEKYGDYILKGKIDLNGFAILDSVIYGLANPRGNFQEHLKQIGTDMESVQDTIPYTSRIAQNIWGKCKQDGYNGIVFTGESDGKVAVIWNRRNFIPYQYSEDNAATWKTLTPDIKSIKRPHDPEYDKDDQAIKFSKILKELSNKEDIGDLEVPDSYNNKIFLKNLKKSENILARRATELNLPQLRESGHILARRATELNLPQLRESRDIGANSATELNLPQLQTSRDINASRATELNLPQLRESGSIHADNATELNLPQLQESGHINASSATKINSPQLRESGSIDADSATELNLPQLRKSWNIAAYKAAELNLPQLRQSGDINANRATELNLPQLRQSGNINADKATELNLPQLQESRDIYANKATELNLPQLQESRDIAASKATKINLPQLRESGSINASSATELNLPQLRQIGNINASSATELNLPQLQESGYIYANNLKKIIIPKKLKNHLTYILPDCQIIHPEDNPEDTPQIKVDENVTFKKYLVLKESLVNIPLDTAYEIFKNEYDKSTGTSWSYEKFMGRARGWEFYGDEKGYVAVRRQRSGFVKLVGMAGDNRSKLKGIQDLVSQNLPLWGMVSKEIKDIGIRKGMREPNFLERQVLKRSIPPEVLGGAEILEYQKDGGIKLQYPDVGVVVKYLVGTPQYYAKLRTMFGDKIKERILG